MHVGMQDVCVWVGVTRTLHAQEQQLLYDGRRSARLSARSFLGGPLLFKFM